MGRLGTADVLPALIGWQEGRGDETQEELLLYGLLWIAMALSDRCLRQRERILARGLACARWGGEEGLVVSYEQSAEFWGKRNCGPTFLPLPRTLAD